jgi:hypothetical protein
MTSYTIELWQAVVLALFAGAVFALGCYFSYIGMRNASDSAPRLLAIGQMMEKADCDVADSAAQYAMILKMSKEEFASEKEKGRLINRAGREVCEIAGSLQSPFRFPFWR